VSGRTLGHLDEPADEPRTSDRVLVRGWVVADPASVVRVRAVVNGATTPLGLGHPRADAGSGLVGFEGWVHVPGPGHLLVEADLDDGSTYVVGERKLDATDPRLPEPRVLIWGRSLDRGGSQLRVAELAEALLRRGARVRVTSEDDGPLRARLEKSGVEVALRPRVPTTGIESYEAGVAAAAEGGAGEHDVVLGVGGTSFAAVDVADRWGVPAVLRIGEAEPLSVVARWLAMPWSPAVEARARRAFTLAAALVTNSEAARRAHLADGWVGEYVVMGDGVDLARIDRRLRSLTRAEARSRVGVARNDVVVLTMGTLWPVKGQSLLVDALARIADEHPSVRLVLVGQQEAEYVRGLQELLVRHGLGERVQMLPYTSATTRWYRAADLVAVPSVSESMPAVALEAMAHRVPVLATRVGDLPDLVRDGETGWLCEPSDVEDLTAALRRAAGTGRAGLRQMGRAARSSLTDEHDSVTSRARWCDLVLGRR
jgi:glycosyltransferase involved in cell wall biosynthesis